MKKVLLANLILLLINMPVCSQINFYYQYEKTWNISSEEFGKISPIDICCYSDSIYLLAKTDKDISLLKIYSKDGNEADQIKFPASGQQGVKNPMALEIDTYSRVIILDDSSSFKIYNIRGDFVGSFSTNKKILDITVDCTVSDSSLIIVYAAYLERKQLDENHKYVEGGILKIVLKKNADNIFVTQNSTPLKISPDIPWAVTVNCGKKEPVIYAIGSQLNIIKSTSFVIMVSKKNKLEGYSERNFMDFYKAAAINIGDNTFVCLSDFRNKNIVFFREDGWETYVLYGKNNESKMDKPFALTFDEQCNLYVLDAGDNSIKKFQFIK